MREERGVWVESYEELAGEVFGVKAYRATQVGVGRTYLKLASRIVYMLGWVEELCCRNRPGGGPTSLPS